MQLSMALARFSLAGRAASGARPYDATAELPNALDGIQNLVIFGATSRRGAGVKRAMAAFADPHRGLERV